ncbi:SH3 domain-containing protein, partial [Rhodococcus sp. IEGM 1351]|nr:SH3 domain-containing protein [Rhodococcus sp. IEGM 1351]
MPAWSAPDPDGAPVARLDPGVELHLLERTGDWAHIICTNGWSAWVDGRTMEEPLTGAPTTPPRSQQVHPTAWSSPDRSRPAPGAAQRVREQPTWRPTHVVPAGGMPAWSAPDPDGAPVARLDPGVELHLLERTGDWAHI